MTECGLSNVASLILPMEMEIKKELRVEKLEEGPTPKDLDTENVFQERRSAHDTTDEESDFPVTTDSEGSANGLLKKSEVTLPPVITVKCGTLTAKMITKLFTCPGIHQNCILIDGETEYISPKEFTVRANKDKQKDWKGSIRIGKSNLRTLMEMRSLDFHDHLNQCSAKCQSRNYITPKDPSLEHNSGRRRSSVTKMIPQTMFSHVPNGFPTATTSLFTAPQKEPQLADGQPTLGTLFKNPTFSRFVAISQNMKNNNTFSTPSTAAQTTTLIPTTSVKEELVTVDDVTTQLLRQQQRVAAANTVPQNIPPPPNTFWNMDATRLPLEQHPQEFLAEMINAGLGDNIIDMIVNKINNMRERIKGISSCSNILLKMLCSLNAADTFCNTMQAVESIQAEIAKEEKLLVKGQSQVHRLSSDYSSLEDESPGRKRSLDIADLIGQPAAKRPSITTSTPEDTPETMHMITPIKPIPQSFPKVVTPQDLLINIASSMNSNIERSHVLAALQMEELRTAAAQ
uniref:SAND domain-containing protein n=1 Tax=Caenorhabditis japonica TaxID=281687 RepID=A0A8R1HH35_CAEJA